MLSLNASAQTPKHEVRAVWLTTIGGIDWPRAHSAATQKQELTRTLDQLQADYPAINWMESYSENANDTGKGVGHLSLSH